MASRPGCQEPLHSAIAVALFTLKSDLHTVGGFLVRDQHRQKYPLHVRAMTQLFLVASQLQMLCEAFLYLVPLWHVMIQHLTLGQGQYMLQWQNGAGEHRTMKID